MFSLKAEFHARLVTQQRFDVFVTNGQFIDIWMLEDLVWVRAVHSDLRKALSRDRDGVIDIDHAYACTQGQFEFIERVFELCRHAKEFGS